MLDLQKNKRADARLNRVTSITRLPVWSTNFSDIEYIVEELYFSEQGSLKTAGVNEYQKAA